MDHRSQNPIQNCRRVIFLLVLARMFILLVEEHAIHLNSGDLKEPFSGLPLFAGTA